MKCMYKWHELSFWYSDIQIQACKNEDPMLCMVIALTDWEIPNAYIGCSGIILENGILRNQKWKCNGIWHDVSLCMEIQPCTN